MGRPKTGKMTITVRLDEENKLRADRAAKKAGKSRSAYIEELLEKQFRKDDIK